MSWSYRRHTEPGDPREQYLVEDAEGGKVIWCERVVGTEEYVQQYLRDKEEAKKRAPIRYRNNGVI